MKYVEQDVSKDPNVNIKKRAKCPFLNNPFKDCYCYRMNSQKTEAAVYYCGSHFDECEIYKKHRHELPAGHAL